MAMELRTEPVFDALKQPLALIESDERRRGIETYIEAARTPLEPVATGVGLGGRARWPWNFGRNRYSTR